MDALIAGCVYMARPAPTHRFHSREPWASGAAEGERGMLSPCFRLLGRLHRRRAAGCGRESPGDGCAELSMRGGGRRRRRAAAAAAEQVSRQNNRSLSMAEVAESLQCAETEVGKAYKFAAKTLYPDEVVRSFSPPPAAAKPFALIATLRSSNG